MSDADDQRVQWMRKLLPWVHIRLDAGGFRGVMTAAEIIERSRYGTNSRRLCVYVSPGTWAGMPRDDRA